MTRILLFGVGGHAATVADAAIAAGDEVVGVVSQDGTAREILPGVRVVASNETFAGLLPRLGAAAAVVGLGDAKARAALAERIRAHLPLATVVHPRATVSPHARIGEGSVVFAGAVVNPGTRIGANAIVNTSASVDHDCEIGDLVHVCPGAVLSGSVRVGPRSWIGVGAVVADHVRIGADVFVSAGGLVTKDIPDGARVMGTRLQRRREPLR